jgi:outer membrane protein TolC
MLPLAVFGQTEKQKVFSADEFIQQVKQYHPVAKQAAIQVEKAKAELLSAKGNFDPTLQYTADRKTFDGTNYYFYNNPELKIPTTLPVDIKTGLEDNGGKYLTSEVTPGQTSYVGVEVNVGKGLLTDKRRTVLKQAKLLQNQTEQERLKAVNDLLFDAYVTYWQWAAAYQQTQIFNKYVTVAANRLRLVGIAFRNGDRAVTDTVEAFVQVQNYKMQLSEALTKLNTASLELSNFLWMANDSAYILPTYFLPDTVAFVNTTVPQPVEDLINQSTQTNPSLKSYDYKLNALDAEKKLKFQTLLPTLNVKANLLNKGYNVVKGVDGNFFENNYKYGIDFKIPLFLREGRGEYKKAKLKIEETNLELQAKKWQIENKIRTYYTEASLLLQQLQLAQTNYNSYDFLLRNEVLKFTNGESSLFMINSRESKLIETQQKIIDLRVKYFKAKYAAEWIAGLLK